MNIEKNYSIRVDVFGPDETVHRRALNANFDILKPEENQKLLLNILEHLGTEIGEEMFPTYRPSQVEILQEQLWRARHGK